MKHSELIRILIKAGCFIKRHGAKHDILGKSKDWRKDISSKARK